MALRKRGVTFEICFRKRGYPERRNSLRKGGGGGVPTLEETMTVLNEMPETTDEKEKWNWQRKAYLKVEMEAMLCATQEQAIQTNYVKHKIDKTAQSPLFRMCDKKTETISHITSECEKLAQKEY